MPAIPSNSIHCTRAMPYTPYLCLWVLFDGPFSTIKYNFVSDSTVTAVANEQPPLIIRHSTVPVTQPVDNGSAATTTATATATATASASATATAASAVTASSSADIASDSPALLLQPSCNLLHCANSEVAHPGDASIRFGWCRCTVGLDAVRQEAPLVAFVVHGTVNFVFCTADGGSGGDRPTSKLVTVNAGCMLRNPSPSTWTHVKFASTSEDNQPAQFFFVRRTMPL
jgi:hypothetical protein